MIKIFFMLLSPTLICMEIERERELYAPFFKAAENGDEEVIDDLVNGRLKLNLDTINKNGETALYIAVANSRAEFVIKLLSYQKMLKIEDIGINKATKKNNRAIHVAARLGDHHMVERLLAYGADIDAQDKDGHTALFIACRNVKIDTVISLLKSGAKVNLSSPWARVTPLHAAVVSENLAIMAMLIKAEADVNYMNRSKFTPLDIAYVSRMSPEIINYLIANGAKRASELK